MSRLARTGLTALWLAVAAATAHARTEPNPAGRPMPQVDLSSSSVSNDAPDRAAALAPRLDTRSTGARIVESTARAGITVNVPLASGAVQLDSTWYDLQDLGSLGTRLVVGADGRVHATWEDDHCELDPAGCPPNPSAPIPFTQRAMGYAVRSATGTWTRIGKVTDPTLHCPQCVSDAIGGFGTIAVTPDGRAAVAQHMNEDGCDLRGDFYLENSPGGSTWAGYLTPIQSPSYQFPQVVALANGSFVVLGEVPRAVSGCTHCGVSDFRVSRLASAGTPFTCPTGWQLGPWTAVAPLTLYKRGFPSFPSLAAGADGRVGIAVTDFGGNVFLIESANGTFNAGTVTIRTLTSYADAAVTATDSTSTQWRPYIHCHLAYNDTTPNVVWSELQARKSGSTIVYVDWRSRIRHWSSIAGVSTVRQVLAGEADGYDNVDVGLAGPLAGFNTISIDWPQVGFSPEGIETYVTWVRFVDAEVDPTADEGLPGICTGTGFGDVAGAVRRPGESWSSAQNLTQTPQVDERYPALAARNPDGRAHVLFQASATAQAGSVQGQDRGTSGPLLVRRIAYLERDLDASLVDVPAGGVPRAGVVRAFPNPAVGRVRFALEHGVADPGAALEIYAAGGRRVATLSLAGALSSGWDGRDAGGRSVGPGLYFARLRGTPGAATRFFYLR